MRADEAEAHARRDFLARMQATGCAHIHVTVCRKGADVTVCRKGADVTSPCAARGLMMSPWADDVTVCKGVN